MAREGSKASAGSNAGGEPKAVEDPRTEDNGKPDGRTKTNEGSKANKDSKANGGPKAGGTTRITADQTDWNGKPVSEWYKMADIDSIKKTITVRSTKHTIKGKTKPDLFRELMEANKKPIGTGRLETLLRTSAEPAGAEKKRIRLNLKPKAQQQPGASGPDDEEDISRAEGIPESHGPEPEPEKPSKNKGLKFILSNSRNTLRRKTSTSSPELRLSGNKVVRKDRQSDKAKSDKIASDGRNVTPRTTSRRNSKENPAPAPAQETSKGSRTRESVSKKPKTSATDNTKSSDPPSEQRRRSTRVASRTSGASVASGDAEESPNSDTLQKKPGAEPEEAVPRQDGRNSPPPEEVALSGSQEPSTGKRRGRKLGPKPRKEPQQSANALKQTAPADTEPAKPGRKRGRKPRAQPEPPKEAPVAAPPEDEDNKFEFAEGYDTNFDVLFGGTEAPQIGSVRITPCLDGYRNHDDQSVVHQVSSGWYCFSSHGRSHPYRGRGPVFENMLSGLDSVLVVARFLDVGRYPPDQPERHTYDQPGLQDIMRAWHHWIYYRWEMLRDRENRHAKREFYRQVCQQLTLDELKTNYVGKFISVTQLWEQCTRASPEYAFDRVTRVNCFSCRRAMDANVEAAEVHVTEPIGMPPPNAHSEHIGDLLTRRFGPEPVLKDHGVKGCKGKNCVQRREWIVDGELPERLVLRLTGWVRDLRGATDDRIVFDYETTEGPRRATYRWLASICYKDNHFRAYMTDVEDGDRAAHVRIYDDEMLGAAIVGGFPPAHPENKIDPWWASGTQLVFLSMVRTEPRVVDKKAEKAKARERSRIEKAKGKWADMQVGAPDIAKENAAVRVETPSTSYDDNDENIFVREVVIDARAPEEEIVKRLRMVAEQDAREEVKREAEKSGAILVSSGSAPATTTPEDSASGNKAPRKGTSGTGSPKVYLEAPDDLLGVVLQARNEHPQAQQGPSMRGKGREATPTFKARSRSASSSQASRSHISSLRFPASSKKSETPLPKVRTTKIFLHSPPSSKSETFPPKKRTAQRRRMIQLESRSRPHRAKAGHGKETFFGTLLLRPAFWATHDRSGRPLLRVKRA